MKNKVLFFTIALLAVIVGGVTYYNMSNTLTDEEIVAKAKNTYSALDKATNEWMKEEGCENDIQICFDKMKKNKTLSPDGFKGIAQHLNIVDSSYYIANDDSVLKQDIQNLDWLPQKSTLFDGTTQEYAWQSVSKITTGSSTGNINATGLFLLEDGTTLSIQLPDDLLNSGFGFFDVNGKKGPNKVGIDIYPFGWGMPYLTETQRQENIKNYGDAVKGFNPYYNEDNSDIYGGLCIAGNGKVKCSDDAKNNPTAYLLKHNEVPNK